jgi:hypothetical protein
MAPVWLTALLLLAGVAGLGTLYLVVCSVLAWLWVLRDVAYTAALHVGVAAVLVHFGALHLGPEALGYMEQWQHSALHWSQAALHWLATLRAPVQ